MGSVAAFEPVVRFAWITGVVSAALSALLVLQVLRMRSRLARRDRRREAVFAAWRPVLFDAIAGGAPRLPSLARDDEDAFLFLWVQLADGIGGLALERLTAIGESVGLRELALRRMRGGDALGHVLGLRTLGYLRRGEDRDEVLRWLDDPHTYFSLAAARALVGIDPKRAPQEILGRLVDRTDWPVPLVASILAGADRARVSAQFARLCDELAPAALPRLLPLASLVDEAQLRRSLQRLLDGAPADPDLLSAALRQVRTPALLEPVRRLVSHDRWSVRVQAAAALGRVGEPQDRHALVALLGDREWWVRYRAAQALATRPFATPDEIVALASHLGDRYARDIVDQALAEARP